MRGAQFLLFTVLGCSIVEVVGPAGSCGVGFRIEGGLGGSRFSEGFTGVLMGTCRLFRGSADSTGLFVALGLLRSGFGLKFGVKDCAVCALKMRILGGGPKSPKTM